jgi:hypothetical protein
MIGRIVWFTMLAAVACLTAGLQIDLMARRSAEIAALVPAPFRTYAQARIVEQAIRAGQGQTALAEARVLVHRRPMPAENLSLLAAAQAQAGDPEAALATIQIAGRRGWREPAAQEAVMRLALAAGDRPEAARRYAALFLHPRPPDALLTELGPAVLSGPDRSGRDALVAVVAGGDRWHGAFLRRGAKVMPPAAFVVIASESMARGARFDCRVLKVSIAELALRDNEAAAQLRAAAGKRCPALLGA